VQKKVCPARGENSSLTPLRAVREDLSRKRPADGFTFVYSAYALLQFAMLLAVQTSYMGNITSRLTVRDASGISVMKWEKYSASSIHWIAFWSTYIQVSCSKYIPVTSILILSYSILNINP
jgi:hypothetical protein